MTPSLFDNRFEALWQSLPSDAPVWARSTGAFTRARAIQSPPELLHLIFLYCIADLSLDHIAGLCAGNGQAITDEALRQRFMKSAEWLQLLATGCLARHVGLPAGLRRTVRIADSTVVNAPGATGTDYRLHANFDAFRQSLAELLVTDCHTAESFALYQLQAGDLWLGDRNYGRVRGLCQLPRHGCQVAVRISLQQITLRDEAGRPVNLAEKLLAAGATEQVQTFAVWIGEKAGAPLQKMWVQARRLSAAQAGAAQRKAKQKAAKKGQRARSLTLDLACWVVVLTSMEPEELSGAEIMEL